MDFELSVDDYEAVKKLIEIGQPAVAVAKFQEMTGIPAEDAAHYVGQIAADLGIEMETPQPPPPSFAPPPDITVPPPSVQSPAPAAPTQPTITRESESRRRSWRDAPNDPDLRWYHHALGFLAFPLIILGGLVGALCFAASFGLNFKLFKSRMAPPVKYVLAIISAGGAYALYFAVAFFALTEEGREVIMTKIRGADYVEARKERRDSAGKRDPGKPSATTLVESPRLEWYSSVTASRESIEPLYHEFRNPPASRVRPPAFPPVPVEETEETLTIGASPEGESTDPETPASESGELEAAEGESDPEEPMATGLALVNPDEELWAEFGKGEELHLIAVGIRMPSTSKEREMEFYDPDTLNPVTPSWNGNPVDPGTVSPSRYRTGPVVSLVFLRIAKAPTTLEARLFDTRTGKEISSGSTQAESVKLPERQRVGNQFLYRVRADIDCQSWHDAPVEIFVDRSETGGKTVIGTSPGSQAEIGIGRIQVGHLGATGLPGLESGAPIEIGKAYDKTDPESQKRSGLLIARISPPAVANHFTLFLTDGERDGYSRKFPEFSRTTEFQAFPFEPTVSGSRGAYDKEKIRPLDFSSAELYCYPYHVTRARYTLSGLPVLDPFAESGNLFNVKIPYLYFRSNDGSLPILKTAAGAVQFKITEAAREEKYRSPPQPREFIDATPIELFEAFEKITGKMVIIDNDAMMIDVIDK